MNHLFNALIFVIPLFIFGGKTPIFEYFVNTNPLHQETGLKINIITRDLLEIDVAVVVAL